MVDPKTQIPNILEALTQHVGRLDSKLYSLRTLHEHFRRPNGGALQPYVGFFRVVYDALLGDLIVGLAKVYSSVPDARRSLIAFLIQVRTHLKTLEVAPGKLSVETIDEQLARIEGLKPSLESVKSRRDRFLETCRA